MTMEELAREALENQHRILRTVRGYGLTLVYLCALFTFWFVLALTGRL
jgi:hypothetical protein